MGRSQPVSYGYAARVAIGVDQLANAVLGGWPDETLSSRAWRRRHARGYWRALAAALNAIAPRHCQRALASERRHWQSPPGAR